MPGGFQPLQLFFGTDRHVISPGVWPGSCRAFVKFRYATGRPLVSTTRRMNIPAKHLAALTLLVLASLLGAGCATTGESNDEDEPTVLDPAPAAVAAAPDEDTAPAG